MNKYRASINDDADDFSSFNNFGQGGGDDDGRRLAREFYQELHNRQSLSPPSSSREGNYIVEDVSCEEDAKASTIKSSGKGQSKFYDTKRKEPTASPDWSSPFLSFLSFFSPATPRPTPSAGLFSGSGITVYSSGRSIRAEIEILETTIKRNDDQQDAGKNSWEGLFAGMQLKNVGGNGGDYAPQQSDEVFRIAVALLIFLSTAYVVFAIVGITEAMTWESPAASLRHGMSLLKDATESSILVSVRHSDMFMDEKAAWLMRQSSDWATLAADAVVRSAGELVHP